MNSNSITQRGEKVRNLTIALFFLCSTATSSLAATAFQGSLKSVSITDSAGTNVPPIASFTYSVSGTNLTVDASGSSDPDGSLVKYKWTWGTNSSQEGKTITIPFTSETSIDVTLTVTDDGNGVTIMQQAVSLLPSCTGEYGPAPATPTLVDTTGNYLILTKISLTCKGTLTKMFANLKSSNTTNRAVKYVIFSDNNSAPGSVVYASPSTMGTGDNVYSSFSLAQELSSGQYWIGIAENPADAYWPRLNYSAGSSSYFKVVLTQQEYDNLAVAKSFSTLTNAPVSGSDRNYGLKVSF